MGRRQPGAARRSGRGQPHPREVQPRGAPEERRRSARVLAAAHLLRARCPSAGEARRRRGDRLRAQQSRCDWIHLGGSLRERGQGGGGAPVRGGLNFRQQILLLPSICILALLVLLGLTYSFASRNHALLARIENRFSPARDLSRDLQEVLGGAQRTLQDAVAAEDSSQLAIADGARDRFFDMLGDATRFKVMEPERSRTLASAFGDYFALARVTSEIMIHNRPHADLTTQLEGMAAGYNRVRLMLEENRTLAHQGMADAFAEAR